MRGGGVTWQSRRILAWVAVSGVPQVLDAAGPRPAPDLYRRRRGRRSGGAGGLRHRPGRPVPGDREAVAGALGAVHPVPGLPARGPPGNLHREPDRVGERAAAEGDPEPRVSSPPSRPPSKCSTWPSGTWPTTRARTPESAARAGSKHSRYSPSTSTDESPRHDNRHDHLHRRSDAPCTDDRGIGSAGFRLCSALARTRM